MEKIVINPLTKDQKTKWLAALRSGEYEQTRGVLVREVNTLWPLGEDESLGFCCLGVLRHVCPEIAPHVEAEGLLCDGQEIKFVALSFEIQNKLVDMNDTLEKDFLQIADYIEANVGAV